MEELSPKVQKAVQVALHQARQWRCPIHWDGNEWQKELDAIAQAAAFEACFYFDEQRGMTLETFVFWQVLTALRDFHRREWAYFAFHCGHLTRASDEGEAGEGDESAEVCEEVATEGLEREWRRYLIFWALERLSERERHKNRPTAHLFIPPYHSGGLGGLSDGSEGLVGGEPPPPIGSGRIVTCFS